MDRVIPINSGDVKSRIITCFTENLSYSKSKTLKKIADSEDMFNQIDVKYEGLDLTLENMIRGMFSDAKEFLLPDRYHVMSRCYDKESLCEHHAIMKLLLSQSVGTHYENEIESHNITYNYKKIKLFENLREQGVSEEGLGAGFSLLKRNQKNLNNIVMN